MKQTTNRESPLPIGQNAHKPAFDPQDQPYTAVIYFHGMGSQRRYVEVSNFVEALEAYDRDTAEQEQNGRRFRAITAVLEESRSDKTRNVAYIDVNYLPEAGRSAGPTEHGFRFYEAYWAPVTACGVPMKEVLPWMIAQVQNPWRALFASWRLRPRYRVSALHAMLRDGRDEAADARTLYEVLRRYDEFGSSRTRQASEYARGEFAEFWRFLRHNIEDRDLRARCLALTRRWLHFYVRTELQNAFVLMTLLVTLLTALIVLVAAVLGIVGWFTAVPFLRIFLPESIAETNTWALVLPILAGGATLFGLKSFFQDYLGDVMFWVTYEETSERHKKRAEILNTCVGLMQHVLNDPRCERVVIVAHSLGTAVAYETLLELGRYNRARYPRALMQGPPDLTKIEHFITFGSPIDKIHYFFQNHKGERYRYNRVIERLRGDISTEPLAANWVPRVHWINFWDRADIISGPLQTPYPLAPRKWSYLDQLRVDNVEVSNGSINPMTSHGLYIENDQVRSIIYACIFQRAYCFNAATATNQDTALESAEEQLFAQRFVGPGRGRQGIATVHYGFLSLSWLAVPLVALVDWYGPLLIPSWLATSALISPILAALALAGTWVGAKIYLHYVEQKIGRKKRRASANVR